MRNLTLASGVWSYKIGSMYTTIKSPEGKRTNHFSWLVAGLDVPSWERGQWKGHRCAGLGPGTIRKFIEETILGKTSGGSVVVKT